MAILDGALTFTDLALGDSPTAMTDNPTTNKVDQCVSGLSGFRGEGGAYVAPFLIVMVSATAFTTSSSATIQVALQDSADGSSGWADILVGNVFTAAQAAAYIPLLASRIPSNAKRYLRVVFRIGTGTMTAGNAIAFITIDKDIVDQALRHTTYSVFTQSNQISEAVANGVALS